MFSNAAQNLSVIDPCNRTGKITIPMSLVTETKGVTDYLRYAGNPPPDAKDLSLCLLFQRGRCNAGTRCNQVHAAPEFVESLRTRAAAVKSCCARHGDVHSASLDDAVTVAITTDAADAMLYSLQDFALTPSLEQAVRTSRGCLVKIAASRLCRLHQKGSCKFGKDCKNVHLCCNAKPTICAETRTAAIIAAPVASVPAAATPAAVVVVAPKQLSTPAKSVAVGIACRAVVAGDVTPPQLPISAYASSSQTSSPGSHIGICDRSSSKANSDDGMGDLASMLRPLNCSLLSGIGEFNSIRASDAHDPLDIDDFSEVSGTDFEAFVDALVEIGPESLASPQWIAA